MLWKQNNWSAQNYSYTKVIRSTHMSNRIRHTYTEAHTECFKSFYPTYVTDLLSYLIWKFLCFEQWPHQRNRRSTYPCFTLAHFNNWTYQWLCRWRIHVIRFMLKKMSTCIVIHFCTPFVGLQTNNSNSNWSNY